MRRSASILLLLAFAAIGAGALARVHQLAHEQADRQAREADTAEHRHAGCHHHHYNPGDGDHAPPRHDESNCVVHAMLGAPLLHAAAAPVLELCGTFVEGVEAAQVTVKGRGAELRVSCRGPPHAI